MLSTVSSANAILSNQNGVTSKCYETTLNIASRYSCCEVQIWHKNMLLQEHQPFNYL